MLGLVILVAIVGTLNGAPATKIHNPMEGTKIAFCHNYFK